MTFGHDVFQRGFAAEVLFRASDDHAELSYQSHTKSMIGGKVVCQKINNPWNVTYSSGYTALAKVQNFPTREAAIRAINEREPTGEYKDLGDLSPSLDDCSNEETTCPEGEVLKFNMSTDNWECAPIETGGDDEGGDDDDSDDETGEDDEEGSNLNTIFLVAAVAAIGSMFI